MCYVAQADLKLADACFEKSLACSIDHVPALVHSARLLILEGQPSIALAEGLLDTLTQTTGWDVAEAWYLLASVYEQTGREGRAEECLLYALYLEESKSVREVKLAVPRVL